MTVFLAALDQTIAAVALPTIVADIGGQSGYSWVGSAYLLSAFLLLVDFVYFIDYFLFLVSACVSPLYGKLSDIVGRKPILFTSIGLFLFGSAMCGAAQNFIWLVPYRGVQGIGGGGIFQMTLKTISDISKHSHP